MPEKGLISHEMREWGMRRGHRKRERELSRSGKKEHQRIATFSFRKLGRTEVVCSVWVSEDTLPFHQWCHPSPVKGKSVFHTSTPTDTPYPQQKTIVILQDGRVKKKNRQGHSTVALISYTIQCAEMNMLTSGGKLHWVWMRVNPLINRMLLYTSEWIYPFVEIQIKTTIWVPIPKSKDLPIQEKNFSTLYNSGKGKMWLHICPKISPHVPPYGCVYVCLCRGEWPGWSPSSGWPPVWH